MFNIKELMESAQNLQSKMADLKEQLVDRTVTVVFGD